MKNILFHLSKVLDYLAGVSTHNNLSVGLEEVIKEQRENLNDLKVILNDFEEYLIELENVESINSDLTLNKLMKIHKYTTDLEWHISEVNELNEEVIKICSTKRE